MTRRGGLFDCRAAFVFEKSLGDEREWRYAAGIRIRPREGSIIESNVDGRHVGADEECEFASPHLGLGRIPGLALDELTEVVAHKNGHVIGQATNAFGDRYEPFLTGDVKGYRRALFQIATARFGPPGHHDDVLWGLKDLREIVELMDRVATATSWKDLLQPFCDRLRASIEQRIAKAYLFVMETGKQPVRTAIPSRATDYRQPLHPLRTLGTGTACRACA